MSEKILFLYSSPNGGHKECANSVRKVIQQNHPSIQTYSIDTISYFYPLLGTLIAKTYLEVLRYTPQIWNYLYDNPDIEEMSREIRQLFNLFNAQKLKSFLKEFQPSAIVCTHAIPCGTLAQQKKKGNISLPLIAIITDFAVHSYWIYPEVDLYIVANQESVKILTNRGILPSRIKVCGIPIDPDFSKNIKSTEARKKLGLDPEKFTVLIMGGSHGHGPLLKIVRELISMRSDIQLIVVAGLNKDIEMELTEMAVEGSLLVFGYTRMVSLLMDAADILITKPGGITSSESLVKGLPLIIIDPIPGQEERNTQYLVESGAAIQIKNISELKDTVRKFRKEPEKILKLKENALKIAHPEAAEEVTRMILELVCDKILPNG